MQRQCALHANEPEKFHGHRWGILIHADGMNRARGEQQAGAHSESDHFVVWMFGCAQPWAFWRDQSEETHGLKEIENRSVVDQALG